VGVCGRSDFAWFSYDIVHMHGGFRLALAGARNWSFLMHFRKYFLVSMASGSRVGGIHTADGVPGGMLPLLDQDSY
jgi:hypothetical protein